jgi:hypothetical protein
MATTTESTLYTDANALGFLKKVALGTTIIPFSVVIPTTNTDLAADLYKLVPLVAKGGRNRLVAVLFQCGDLDTGTALDADLTVYQAGAHTIIHNAGAGFQSATALTLVVPLLALDDSADDGIADLCFLVNTAAQTPLEGTISGLAFYE